MVFGLGKKEIEVDLGKYGFSPGETIAGKVTLKLKRPTEARQLRVELIGERTITRMGRGSTGRDKSHIYDFKMPLDGEKTYSGGEYYFQVKIPSNILQTVPMPGGAVGEAVKAVEFLSGIHTRISWFVRAILDRPGKKDISSKNVQVAIG
jgi:hypothetical protein